MTDIPTKPLTMSAPLAAAAPANHERTGLRAAAEALEATFIDEMLKHAGVGKTPEGFGGGVGEDQFAGFLRRAQAEKIAAQGGIGLAEQIIKSMTRNGGQDERS